ncbi:MAG: Mov34/MPN/PAD-1 family protein [Pseudomonadota bacterium]
MDERTAVAIETISRALRLVTAHPAVEGILASVVDPETHAAAVDLAVRLGLPNAWMADGISPNGVRAVEPVTLIFPAAFPLKPPQIYLRADFDRSLAHVNPGSANERPVPCIYDGSLAELLQQQGLAGILNQLVLWLENAALGRLIDPRQGWEPVRRDSLDDFIVADAAHLRSLVSRQEGSAIFRFDYFRYPIGGGEIAFHGEVGREPLKVNPKSVGDLFGERGSRKELDAAVGRSLVIFVWPGKQPSGQPIIADRYRPETVTDFGGLMARAADYGCVAPLRAALGWLERCFATYQAASLWPIAIVLCARRPFHVIGSSSALELCPYLVEIGAPRLFPEGDRTRVRPAGHRHAIAAPLLRSMSGGDTAEETQPWIQVGAGSLGSKIALHLARSGWAPSAVVDRASLSPHNAARHALVPSPGTMQISWIESKASALATAIKGLGQAAEAHVEDIIGVTRDADRAKCLLPKKSWAIINSTASLAVREALASVPPGITIPRVIETSLFADGRIGLLSVEGPARNPNTGDLITESYALMREDATLRDLVFAGDDALRRQVIGEGCGSATMVMSDAQISMLAAPMAEALVALRRTGMLAGGGRVLLGNVADDGMSLSWRIHEVAPWVSLIVDEAPSWRVRIADRAHRKILDEVARWPTVETGGILVGRFSEAAQTFHVVDVLPAPEDSSRSATEFVLGTAGARATLTAYAERCNYSLYCLGTWHSHLGASGPSSQDRATAIAVALARLMPSVLLIHTPVGYRAALAEPSSPSIEPPSSASARAAGRTPALNSSP